MEAMQRIEAFVKLGKAIKELSKDDIENLFYKASSYNNWFTLENIETAIIGIGNYLDEDKLNKWLQNYSLNPTHAPKKIGVIMAGNIPLAGFHDFMAVLLSGHQLIAKLSADDPFLLKYLFDVLVKIEPGFADKAVFAENLKSVDAIIATGSNSSAQYFNYYFAKYPHIIRKNRNSCAVLTGIETKEDFNELGKDIFTYFGLGCRSISKLFVPENYNWDSFYQNMEAFKHVSNHHKYVNNYDYHKSIYLVNKDTHLDNGFLLLKEDQSYASPVSVVFYEYYKETGPLINTLQQDAHLLQCVVSNIGLPGEVAFGKSQSPDPWNYADNADTLAFLLNLQSFKS